MRYISVIDSKLLAEVFDTLFIKHFFYFITRLGRSSLYNLVVFVKIDLFFFNYSINFRALIRLIALLIIYLVLE